LGKGCYEDALFLLELAKSEVKKRYGIVLQEEIKLL
jgi:UDP-N-acetylenolpyruvoylglucosamine reductase